MKNALLLLLSICLTAEADGQKLPFEAKKDVSKKAAPSLRQVSALSSGAASAYVVPEHRTCFSVEMEEKIREQHPGRPTVSEFEEVLKKQLNQYESRKKARTNEEIYAIPVIVHVVHNGERIGTDANITAEQIYSQFDVLNEDFRRTGAGVNEHPDGADAYIEFYPAGISPSGSVLEEPGINRINGEKGFWEGNEIEKILKPGTIWDSEQYLNIWVINFGGDMEGVLGYAQFPSLSGLEGLSEDVGLGETDGIVVGYPFFGSVGNVAPPFDKGRTATHEIGHWLGLRHIWGDGRCDADDYCMDTPNAGQANYGCSDNDSCSDDDLPDMIENYMDYTDDACMNIFTNDQKARMRTVLEVSPRRSSLWGPRCEDAEEVVAGTNTTVPSLWYSFTAQSETIVTVSSVGQTTENTYLSLYTGCSTTPINVNDDAFGTEQSELSVLVEEGETIKIWWSGRYSTEAFNWTLSTSRPENGAVCALAVDALQGDNLVPATDLNTYWYRYMLNESEVKMLIETEEVNYVVYKSSCSHLVSVARGHGMQKIYDLVAGDEIFFAFETDAGGDFNWTMSVEVLEPGEVCSTAVEASEGTNILSAAPYWFTYTVPEYGHVTISSEGLTTVETYAQVYEACEGVLLADNQMIGDSQTEIYLENLPPGLELKILWDSVYSPDGFDWSLEFTELMAGEICEYPAMASVGVNEVPETQQELYYTIFTMTENENKVVITTDAEADVFAVTNNCDDPEVLTYDSGGLEIIGLNQGEEILIVWDVQDGGGFTWDIALKELEEGESCAFAAVANEGQNAAEKIPKWYTFTMPVSGDLFVSSVGFTEEDTYLLVYDACDGNVLAENDDYVDYQSAAWVEGLKEGESVIIYWDPYYSSAGFEWELLVDVPEPGDKCEDPVDAVKGTNYVPQTGRDLFWTRYVMPETNSKLVITSSSGDDILVTNEDCNDLWVQAYGNQNLVTTGIEKGQEVLIIWQLDDGGDFEWELAVEPLSSGDDCNDPIAAVSGKNAAAYAPLWYTYTMPENGDLTISSVGQTTEDTYLYILDGCEGKILGENDDQGEDYQSEVTLRGLMKDKIILIYWSSEYSSAAFDWKLTAPGGVPEVVEIPVPVSIDEDTPETIMIDDLSAVFSDPDGDELTYSVSSEEEELEVSITEENTVVVMPVADFNGTATVVISASDGRNTSSDRVMVDVKPVNDPPRFSLSRTSAMLDQDFTTTEIIEIELLPPPADEAEETITFSLTPDISDLIGLNLNEERIEMTAVTGAFGEQTFSLVADDGQDTNATSDLSFTITVKIVLGVPEDPTVNIYPNPADQFIRIESFQVLDVFIYDLTGALVKKDQSSNPISVADLSQGTYLIRLTDSGGRSVTHRIIKRN